MTINNVYTDESINSFIFQFNIHAIISLFFGLLSIFIIQRYTNKSMENYKIHLLNITITILICDLVFCTLCRPYFLYPIPGMCSIGLIVKYFNGILGDVLAKNLSVVSFLLKICSGIHGLFYWIKIKVTNSSVLKRFI